MIVHRIIYMAMYKSTPTTAFTWLDIWCAFVKDGSGSRLGLFSNSGTFLVTWTWISPLLTPWSGIHLSDISFGGSLWYSTTQSPMLDVGSKALWSFTCNSKGLPSSGNSKVWCHWGFNVLYITWKAIHGTVKNYWSIQDQQKKLKVNRQDSII